MEPRICPLLADVGEGTAEILMPLVQITLLKGRTAEQKRKIAQRITDALVEEAKTKRDGIVITFLDVETDSYARGGVLIADQK
jgi:4-oxalocrotonate tautomerase